MRTRFIQPILLFAFIILCSLSLWLGDFKLSEFKSQCFKVGYTECLRPALNTIFHDGEVISVVIAVLYYYLEAPERKKQSQYQAWQVISLAHGQTGSGGRIQALQYLNKDKVILKGVAAPGAVLSGINLEGAKLARANFEGAHLDRANLKGADLHWANLRDAYFWDSRLERTDLRGAHLKGAELRGAHLEGAVLWGADLEGADLWGAHLKGANLREVHLDGAVLWGADLEGADLRGAHLEGANLRDVDLSKVQNLTKEQIRCARVNSLTIFPDYILNPEDIIYCNYPLDWSFERKEEDSSDWMEDFLMRSDLYLDSRSQSNHKSFLKLLVKRLMKILTS